jgi:hypothetical protein
MDPKKKPQPLALSLQQQIEKEKVDTAKLVPVFT